eukprot:GHVL01001782.1.p1 GENE.GHVL01001782.1~~GHVL01001782.1.p1  ORF type:complete len:205 (+),score=39.56 GHVL01001782.1:49-663(+)
MNSKDFNVLPEGHGRQITCIDMKDNLCLTGSADHGLRLFDWESGRFIRQLYSKRFGHNDWVTDCKFTESKMISTGMDNKICVWEPTGVKCTDLTNHKSSVAGIHISPSNHAVTWAYDGEIILWDLNGPKALSALRGGHSNPVVSLEWQNRLLISGDRSGKIVFWDVETGQILTKSQNHVGNVTKIHISDESIENNIIVTSGHDG